MKLLQGHTALLVFSAWIIYWFLLTGNKPIIIKSNPWWCGHNDAQTRRTAWECKVIGPQKLSVPTAPARVGTALRAVLRKIQPRCWGWGEVQAVRASCYLCNLLCWWRANVNGYHMKEQYSHLFCTMVKRMHKLHSDRVRPEPVNPNSENQSQRRVSNPGRNGIFCFLERTFLRDR